MLYHFEFLSGGNPYISLNDNNFMMMFRKYNIETIKPGFYMVHGLNKDKSYNAMKEKTRRLAIEYQTAFSEVAMSLYEMQHFQNVFETLGSRYGLIREFRENAIV